MDDEKIDDSIFKSFCEGALQTVSFYADGSNEFNHTCKLISTMNEILSIKIDSGTTRRIIVYSPLFAIRLVIDQVVVGIKSRWLD